MTKPLDRSIGNGIHPATIAQIFRRADGRFSFRYHDGKRYRSARELVGNDLGWATKHQAEIAARGHKIRNVVDITDEWDGQA
jgi:hypothetical protein